VEKDSARCPAQQPAAGGAAGAGPSDASVDLEPGIIAEPSP